MDLIPKAPAIKAKTEKWDYTKLKEFFTAKASSTELKKQQQKTMEWKKTFANHTSDKESISKIYKELL